MIRFIDLGDQICEGQREFCFFNTISDTFEGFGGMSDVFTFSSIEQFSSYLEYSVESKKNYRKWLEYIPKDFFNKTSEKTT